VLGEKRKLKKRKKKNCQGVGEKMKWGVKKMSDFCEGEKCLNTRLVSV
jgi:hypothetical protein